MTFTDLVKDIERLIGLELQSIRPGAEITVLGIDYMENRLEIRNSKGEIRSRPLSELEKIWTELTDLNPVHVDQVLGGSGSSRNQPETVLANLPYIEWLKIGGKKHIANVGHASHPIGTLKQMDDVQADTLVHFLREQPATYGKVSFIHVTNDVAMVSRTLSNLLNSKLEAIEQGVYKASLSDKIVLIVSENAVSYAIPQGTYGVLTAHTIPDEAVPMKIGTGSYYFYISGQFPVLLFETS